MKKIIFGLVLFFSIAHCEDKPTSEVVKVFKISSKHSDDGKTWHGTAFYISKTRLLTAAHVIKKSVDQWIVKGDRRVHCKVIKCDYDKDIAVLESDEENEDFFRLVSKIKVLGFPKGEFYEEASGVIDADRIHARCHFVKGMSGGPIVNEYGDVEGMGTDNRSDYDCKFIPACALAEFVKSIK